MTQIKSILTKEAKRQILDENMLPYDPQLAAALNAAEQVVLKELAKHPSATWQPIETVPSFTVLLLADLSTEGEPVYETGMTAVSGKFIDATETRLLTPTHWMQIPKPPRGDGHE